MEDTERSNAELSKQKVDLQSLPTQVYLDQTVVLSVPKKGGLQYQSNLFYKALFISKYFTETQPKTPKSKQCRGRSTVAGKNSLERQESKKKPREEPGSNTCPFPVSH